MCKTACSLSHDAKQTAAILADLLLVDKDCGRAIIAFSPEEIDIAKGLFDKVGGVSCNFVPKGKDVTYVLWGFPAPANVQIVIVMMSIDDEQAGDIASKMTGRRIPLENIVVAAVCDDRKIKDGLRVVSVV
jgi:hypothetical protein